MRNRGAPYTTTLQQYLADYVEGLREISGLSASAQLALIVQEHLEAKAANLSHATENPSLRRPRPVRSARARDRRT